MVQDPIQLEVKLEGLKAERVHIFIDYSNISIGMDLLYISVLVVIIRFLSFVSQEASLWLKEFPLPLEGAELERVLLKICLSALDIPHWPVRRRYVWGYSTIITYNISLVFMYLCL